MANIATLNSQDALDIVQDTMEKMVRKYSDKQPQEWPPIFYRILHNCIMDFHRKKKFRNLFFFWQQHSPEEDSDNDENDRFIGYEQSCPEQLLSKSENIETMLTAIESLPKKQQQCFLLRCWQGFSVAKTAEIMECSQGTIKTHYSRAVAKLKGQLESLDA